jgi:hypothetical protein
MSIQTTESDRKRDRIFRAGEAFYKASGIKSVERKNRRTKNEITRIKDTILEILETDNPQTVRQVYYRLVVRGLIGKTEQEYDGTVCRLLGEMREDDVIAFDWIADNTRWKRRPVTYTGLSSAIYTLAHKYRRNLWIDAEDYCEVWVEKDALAGVIIQETDPLDVPVLPARAYSSKSFVYGAAEDIAAQMEHLKRIYVYHLGDSDPSGEDAARDIEEKLRRYVKKIRVGEEEVELHFKRLAVLDEQIEQWNLPLRPNKAKDTRTAKFRRQAGSVELDALPAAELRKIVRDAIEPHVDHDLHAALKRQQDGEQRYLKQWPELFRQGHGWGILP